MTLQECGSHIAVDLTFDGAFDNARLVFAGGENRDLARGKNGGDAHRDRLARYVWLAEEIGGSIATRDVIEVDRTGETGFARAGFVKANVPRLADTEQLEVDAAGSNDCALVGSAGSVDFGARRRATEQMHIRGIDIDVREKVLPHESMVRVNAFRRHRPVFIEIEGDNIGEAESLVAMQSYQFTINADRCGAGGKAQHKFAAIGRALANEVGDASRDNARNGLVVVDDDGRDPLARAKRCIWERTS